MVRRPGPRLVAAHLSQSTGRLAKTLRYCQRLGELNKIFLAFVPPHLAPHCRLVAADQYRWLIEAEGAAWGARVRFQLQGLRQQLIRHLKRELPPFKLRIRPAAEPRVVPKRPPMTLSADAADTVAATARGIEDPRLRAALERLARHRRE